MVMRTLPAAGSVAAALACPVNAVADEVFDPNDPPTLDHRRRFLGELPRGPAPSSLRGVTALYSYEMRGTNTTRFCR